MSAEPAASNAGSKPKSMLITTGQNHFPMRYTGFVKNRTCTAKPHSFVETDHRNLGVKVNVLRILSSRHCDSAFQEPPPNAFFSKAFQNSHSSDLRAAAAHHDPRGSHGVFSRERQKMHCSLIIAIQLNLFRYLLFSHEHTNANGESLF